MVRTVKMERIGAGIVAGARVCARARWIHTDAV